jgi:hypothetical protein
MVATNIYSPNMKVALLSAELAHKLYLNTILKLHFIFVYKFFFMPTIKDTHSSYTHILFGVSLPVVRTK